MSTFLLSELIDIIFEYLDLEGPDSWKQDIRACSLVNREFYEHAIRFLYHTLYLVLNSEGRTLHRGQEKLWQHLHRKSHLVSNIRRLEIDLSSLPYPLNQIREKIRARTVDRFVYIIRHARLESIYLYNRSGKERRALEKLLNAIANLDTKPDVYFHFNDGAGNAVLIDPVENGDLLWKMKEKLFIKHIIINNSMPLTKFNFLAEFRQLERLSISVGDRPCIDETTDLQSIFEGVPIKNLWIHAVGVKSLPSTLEILDISGWRRLPHEIVLGYRTWTAICELEKLHTLRIHFSVFSSSQYPPCQFKSSNCLRSLDITIGAETEQSLVREFFDPILQNCSRLKFLRFEPSFSPLSSSLLASLFKPGFKASSTLASLEIQAANSNYSFQNFLSCAKVLPHLKSLILPWPVTVGEVHTEAQEPDRHEWCIRDHGEDIPECLMFQHCQSLAIACPKLDEVKFLIDHDETADNSHEDWKGIPTGRTFYMPVYCERLNVDEMEFCLRLQIFKLIRFIDEYSPCLNLCTVMFHHEENSYFDHCGPEIGIFLSLNQVRRHFGHL